MINLTKKEIQVVHRHINSFLRHFEIYPQEEKFWNETYNIDVLKNIRNKLEEQTTDA